jgi:hypothetical protein
VRLEPLEEWLRRIPGPAIDAGLALVVAVASVLAVLTFNRISALVTDVPGLAARGGFDLLTSRGDVVDASSRFGLSLWNKSVLYVQQAFVALIIATFLYQWSCLALTGRTVGKALLGLKVVVWAVAVGFFCLNALPVLFSGRRSLADRVAGTVVTTFEFRVPPAMRTVRTS